MKKLHSVFLWLPIFVLCQLEFYLEKIVEMIISKNIHTFKLKMRYIIFIFFAIGTQLFGQHDIDVKNYSADDGIDAFRTGIEDKNGYTWFQLVDRGVYYIYNFDGKKFRSFQCGSIWFGSRNAVFGNKHGNNNLIKDKVGDAFFGASKGIYKIVNGRPLKLVDVQNGLVSDTIITMTFDGHNNLWFFTNREMKVALYKNGTYTLTSFPREYSFKVSEVILKFKEKVKFLLDCDSLGNVWWGMLNEDTKTSTIFKSSNLFSENPKVSKFEMHDFSRVLKLVDGGLLFKSYKEVWCFMDSLGSLTYIDKKFSSHLGSDNLKNHYFYSKIDEKYGLIYRDKPKVISDFGKSKTVYVFPKKVPGEFRILFLNDEIWLTQSASENGENSYVLRGDSMTLFKDMYPHVPFKNMMIHETENNIFWAHTWQKKNAFQLFVSNSTEISSLFGNVNGSGIKYYSPLDSIFYFQTQIFEGKGCNLFSVYKNQIKPLIKNFSREIEVENKHIWINYRSEKLVLHILPNGVSQNEYKLDLPDKFNLTLNGEGSYFRKDSSTIGLLLYGKILNYSFHFKNEKIKSIHTIEEKGVYIVTTTHKICFWNPLNEIEPRLVKGLPDGEINNVYKATNILCFQKGNRAGWIKNEKIYFIDTTKVAIQSKNINIEKSDKNRLIIYDGSSKQLIKNFYVFEDDMYKSYQFNDSLSVRTLFFPEISDDSDELIYFSESKIYRFNKTLGTFYFIKNIGRNMPYTWSARVINNMLYISGWSSSIIKIDLDKCPVTFPNLSFSGISINTKEIEILPKYTISYGESFIANFIGIEKINQRKIAYQHRILGIDTVWSVPSSSELKEFNTYIPGEYHFEVRVKGESEIWSKPIGFDFTILAPWYKTAWAYSIYLMLLIGMVWVITILNSKRLHHLNQQLQTKIFVATEEISKQKNIIEAKHIEIVDSINYAERIQRSFLATKELLDVNLNPVTSSSEAYREGAYEISSRNDSQRGSEPTRTDGSYFVFFRPKDVVSGDFYWASTLKNGNFALVTADSTGHGVPGAIMSILNITCLENSVKEGNVEPKDILNHTRTNIIERLKNDGSAEGGKDGMDCSIISLNKEKTKLTYSGANNPVWIVRTVASSADKGGVLRSDKVSSQTDVEFIELEPNKMPVGKHDKDDQSFTQKEVLLQSGDLIYTLTDGYPDQFGGPKGKKFMYKKLKELLISIASKSMEEQYKILANTFTDWKGDSEQVDDITIIGVRV